MPRSVSAFQRAVFVEQQLAMRVELSAAPVLLSFFSVRVGLVLAFIRDPRIAKVAVGSTAL